LVLGGVAVVGGIMLGVLVLGFILVAN